MHIRSLCGLLVLALFAYGCSDPAAPPTEALVIRNGNNQSALAGTALPAPVVVALQDPSGNPIAGQTATFTVTKGGGFISNSTGQTNSDGTITAPTWTLGKSAVAQEMQVTVGGKTVVVDETVQTAYTITVRFFGPSLSSTQQAYFTNAAARIKAVIVGAVPAVDVTGADVSSCTGTTMPKLSGTIDGVVIYASLDSIDGPSKTLAQSGPCFIRVSNGVKDYRTAIGRMTFDSSDIAPLVAQGQLERVITHEMFHVLGFGTAWDSTGLIVNAGTATTAYVGASGVAGCKAVGGVVTCANSVPLENCVGRTTNCGAGQLDSHWRESTFGTELMTAYLDPGAPLSVMTIKSFEDLNYTVNTAAADAYTITVGSLSGLSAGSDVFSSAATSADWERPVRVPIGTLPVIRANSRGAK